MREIGGYFELEQLIRNEYYNDLIPLNTGRNALLYIMKAKKIRKVYLPYFLCSVIKDNLIKYNYEVEYYNINENFKPIFNKILKENEYIYIVNYYGQLDNSSIINLKNKYNRIIIDNTHAFFQEPIKGIDTIYNCRKFFGVPDGAYLSTNIIIKESLDIDISKNRMEHILGRYEGTASEYYNYFKDNDIALSNETPKYMSKLTHNILGAIDYKNALENRNKNYNYLHKNLEKYNKIKLLSCNGPFAYPLYTNNGDKVRKKLLNEKIYIPTLWPNVLSSMIKDSIEYDYASNILPLPCDQRYDIRDMEYLVNKVKDILK